MRARERAHPTRRRGVLEFEQMFGYPSRAQPERFHISARDPSPPSVVFRTFWTSPDRKVLRAHHMGD
jgi:hypothetical protein